MFEKFTEHFDGMEFDSIEEYNGEVLRLSNDIEEELGRAERWALSGDEDVLRQLGVTIKGMEDEDAEDREVL